MAHLFEEPDPRGQDPKAVAIGAELALGIVRAGAVVRDHLGAGSIDVNGMRGDLGFDLEAGGTRRKRLYEPPGHHAVTGEHVREVAAEENAQNPVEEAVAETVATG